MSLVIVDRQWQFPKKPRLGLQLTLSRTIVSNFWRDEYLWHLLLMVGKKGYVLSLGKAKPHEITKRTIDAYKRSRSAVPKEWN